MKTDIIRVKFEELIEQLMFLNEGISSYKKALPPSAKRFFIKQLGYIPWRHGISDDRAKAVKNGKEAAYHFSRAFKLTGNDSKNAYKEAMRSLRAGKYHKREDEAIKNIKPKLSFVQKLKNKIKSLND